MSRLHTEDPTLAIVIERLDNLRADFAEHRRETREELDKVNKQMKPIVNVMEKASGGYLVLVGLGGILAYALGVFDKLKSMFFSN